MDSINKLSSSLPVTPRMPVLFLGHGSPMNAIEENQFVKGFRKVSEVIPKPAAILCVSAHWETVGTKVTIMEKPRTIHDFGGFPPELYQIQYPAPGSPLLANETIKSVSSYKIQSDAEWGLDHGAWSVIKHLYPDASVPVVQMSLDIYKNPDQHYEIAGELASLRSKGVLIIGSGNMVHNLGMVDWRRLADDNYGFDWAVEANLKMKEYIVENNHKSLINYRLNGSAFRMAVPTPEHYLPMLYVLSLRNKNENVSFFNDKAVGGSLTMTSFIIS